MVRDDGILKVLDFGLAGHSDARGSEEVHGLLRVRRNSQLHVSGADSRRNRDQRERRILARAGAIRIGHGRASVSIRLSDRHSPRDCAHGTKAAFFAQSEDSRKLDTLLLRMLSKDPRQRPTALEVDQQLSLAGPAKPGRRSAAIAWAAAISVVAICRRFRLYVPRQALSEKRASVSAVNPPGE